MSTFGPAYSPTMDGPRLRRQHEIIRDLMLDGQWRSLRAISAWTGFPEASVSAQLRHLRKRAFGEYLVEKQRDGDRGLWLYRVTKRDPDKQQIVMFK